MWAHWRGDISWQLETNSIILLPGRCDHSAGSCTYTSVMVWAGYELDMRTGASLLCIWIRQNPNTDRLDGSDPYGALYSHSIWFSTGWGTESIRTGKCDGTGVFVSSEQWQKYPEARTEKSKVDATFPKANMWTCKFNALLSAEHLESLLSWILKKQTKQVYHLQNSIMNLQDTVTLWFKDFCHSASSESQEVQQNVALYSNCFPTSTSLSLIQWIRQKDHPDKWPTDQSYLDCLKFSPKQNPTAKLKDVREWP